MQNFRALAATAEDEDEDAEEALANARRLCAQLRGQRAAAAAKDGAFGEAQLGSTDTQRVDKLHVSYTAWARNLSQIEDSDRRTQHIGHGFVMCSLEPGCRLVSAFLTTLEGERLWLSDSWLPRRLANRCKHADAAKRLKLTQQPDCTFVNQNAEHGKWFQPIDDSWFWGDASRDARCASALWKAARFYTASILRLLSFRSATSHQWRIYQPTT